MRGYFPAVTPLVAIIGVAGAQAQAVPPYAAPAPYAAPQYVQPLTDADLLANEIRALAANPLDLTALVRAGELALKLDDPTAAAAFFARAERIDPRNARVKAGEGSLMVGAERPGEALRRFAEAAALGADPRSFAADRGLAYDLIGEQDRAQRDYRVALRGGNDETIRRYALSLGISGKRELALAQIDPLLRKSDRGAWRARAFILAMSGDRGGAERIATSMMPTGMAQGLQPFFDILPTLRPADRAFAVHFGEVRSTPERQFDARLVPPLAALGPDPTAPVELAAATRPVAVAATPARKERKSRRDRKREALAAATVPPPVPLPAPPSYAGQASGTPAVTPASTTVRVPAAPTPAPVAVALRPPVVIALAPPRTLPTETRLAAVTPPVVAPPAAAPPVVVAAPSAAPLVRVPVATIAGPPPSSQLAAAPPNVTPAPVRSEESILAAIIADIKVPGAELAAAPVEPAPVAAPPPKRVAARPTGEAPAIDAARALADKKAADRKATADKKAADAKKLADAKKAAEEKKKKDPKFLEPSRIWVQVAGGANEGDLPKQWAKLRTGAPAAFKGRQGWTTPLRATNRILAGPFKSDDEAQAFVNAVAKQGISGFVFVSDAGQKISKLPGK